MIRIAIIILVLLIGCAMPPEPEPRFVGQYLSLHMVKPSKQTILTSRS